jgi:hypothetical protein
VRGWKCGGRKGREGREGDVDCCGSWFWFCCVGKEGGRGGEGWWDGDGGYVNVNGFILKGWCWSAGWLIMGACCVVTHSFGLQQLTRGFRVGGISYQHGGHRRACGRKCSR